MTSTILRLPAILRLIEKGNFLPYHSYHVRGRTGRFLTVGGDWLCYPLEHSESVEQLKKLLLLVEDKRFYQHGAIDVKGILRATVKNLGAGKVIQGGSTITQQLARTLFLDSSRTWVRKLAETIIAFKLERHLTKEQILDAYCSFVYTGYGSRGFEAASRVIYRKSFKSLGLDQIPALIGLLGAPERFHPKSSERRFWNRAEQKARSLGTKIERIPLNPIRISRASNRRIGNIAQKEMRRLELPRDNVKAIELTLDETLQKSVDQTLKGVSTAQEVAQVAAVVICNRTGDILAESVWVNGMQGEFSPSFSGSIQPGSTFKTFALLTAIEQGLSADMLFESSPYNSAEGSGDTWGVRNYRDKYYEQLSLAEALLKSDNTVFARLIECLGVADLAATYERFLLVKKCVFTKSTVLGGLKDGVSLLQLTNAYSTIARNGVMIEPRLLRFIEYRDNTSIFIKPCNGQIVAGFSAVQMLKQILALSGLKDVSYGLSGKTGTTKKGSLFTGYNEDISIGLWLGFHHEQPEEDHKALTAMSTMKMLAKNMLAWSEKREFAII